MQTPTRLLHHQQQTCKRPRNCCTNKNKHRYDRTVRTQVRAEWKLHFIEWGGRLVFDAANPTVFAGYCEIMRIAAVAAAAAAAAAGASAGAAADPEAPSADDAATSAAATAADSSADATAAPETQAEAGGGEGSPTAAGDERACATASTHGPAHGVIGDSVRDVQGVTVQLEKM
jgi:hypothetical protein